MFTRTRPASAASDPDRESTTQPASRHPGATVARFYMSGDLRSATGLSRTHLDFYLREGIVQPTARTESGYLLFDDDELERLRRVIAWRQEGVGLREIRERLGRVSEAPAGPPQAATDR